MRILRCFLAKAAVMKHHRPSGSHGGSLLSHRSGAQRSGTEPSAGLVSPGDRGKD